jgi:ABC-type multidrug transport system ATPase subunit
MIRIEEVTKRFDAQRALDRISLEIRDGELFVVIGPDGAGKSTLFRLLVTLLLPDEGRIMVNGLDTVKDFRELRTVIGYMPGTFSLYPDLTVEENLSFYARIFGTDLRSNYDLIREVYEQIAPFKDRQAGKLSGGMKQKLALSCALIHRPAVLVLDEPTTGVDAASRKEFWQMLRKIREEGITVVVSTAYMDEASQGDRTAFLHRGKVLQSGTAEEIRAGYPFPLYACRSEDNFALLKALRREPSTAMAMLYGKTIHYSPSGGEVPVETILQTLQQSGTCGDIEYREAVPTLEDSFAWLSGELKEERREEEDG